jgi:hypothetical protein
VTVVAIAKTGVSKNNTPKIVGTNNLFIFFSF